MAKFDLVYCDLYGYKVKVNLSLRSNKYHAMKTYWGSGV
jgi:hypothetical protein